MMPTFFMKRNSILWLFNTNLMEVKRKIIIFRYCVY